MATGIVGRSGVWPVRVVRTAVVIEVADRVEVHVAAGHQVRRRRAAMGVALGEARPGRFTVGRAAGSVGRVSVIEKSLPDPGTSETNLTEGSSWPMYLPFS
jgi:hypothetical protein